MIHTTRAILRTFTLLCASALFAACASGPPQPTVDYKTDYNFRAVKKIAFLRDTGQVYGVNPLQLSDMQRDRIHEALSYALTNRGFQMVADAAQADLLLSWNLVTEQVTDVRQLGFSGHGLWWRIRSLRRLQLLELRPGPGYLCTELHPGHLHRGHDRPHAG